MLPLLGFVCVRVRLPVIGAKPSTNTGSREMSTEETIDTLEIADLEQDIGGMCAVEPAESRVTVEGFIVTTFLPK
jgi:hypothetical protein